MSVTCRSPNPFSLDLSHSFNGLSLRLAEFRRHAEALNSNEEALSIYGPLATHRPEVPHLALSRRLLKFGCHQKVLEVSEEALSIYRLVAAGRPIVFHSELSRSLSNHLDILFDPC
jgi:hypothetical protein